MADQYPTFDCVPQPPETGLWDDFLRWCLFVMNRGDPQRQFAASCLTWALRSGGLTDRQSAACARMLRRILTQYSAGALDCQTEAGASAETHLLGTRLH